MNKDALAFLAKEKVCVVGVILKDGSPHTATVHFSHQEGPLRLFIQTSNSTKKASPFLDGSIGKATVTLGFSEEEWLTLQMHGTIRAVTDQSELEQIYTIHYQKHPDAEQYKGPNTIFLEFTPTWLRFTDFNTEPETIFEGE